MDIDRLKLFWKSVKVPLRTLFLSGLATLAIGAVEIFTNYLHTADAQGITFIILLGFLQAADKALHEYLKDKDTNIKGISPL